MSPPLTPDADQARQLLQDELSKPEYSNPASWLEDQFRRLIDWLLGGTKVPAAGLSDSQVLLIAVAAIAVTGAVLWLLMGPVRRERRARAIAVLADETRTAAELRAAAAELAAAGDWTAATLQAFRALVRSLAERTIIAETPGITAHEAAGQAAERLPSMADRLAGAADVFDELAYGDRRGEAAQYEEVVALDAALLDLRPEAVGAGVES